MSGLELPVQITKISFLIKAENQYQLLSTLIIQSYRNVLFLHTITFQL